MRLFTTNRFLVSLRLGFLSSVVVMFGLFIAYFFNPYREVLLIVVGLAVPILIPVLGYLVGILIHDYRNSNEDEYQIHIEEPGKPKLIASLSNCREAIANSNESAVIRVERQPPKLSEISLGVDLMMNAISALVVSNLIYHYEISSSQRVDAAILNTSFFILVVCFVITVLMAIALRAANKQKDEKARETYILNSNILGIIVLAVSFFILGDAII
jgi:hypothetical protein